MKKKILLLLALCLGLNFTAKGMDSSFVKPEANPNDLISFTHSFHGLFNEFFVYSQSPYLHIMDARYKFIGYDPAVSSYKYKDLLNSDSKLKKALKVAGVTTLATAYWVGVAILLDHFAKTKNWNLPEWMKKYYTAGQLSDFAKKAALIVRNEAQQHVLTPLANISKAGFAKTVQFAKTQAPKVCDAIISLSKKTYHRIAEHFKSKPTCDFTPVYANSTILDS
ncbi:MAG: hypothetical protein WC436_01660 [Candidatus Babeliales bacterium]